MTIGSCKNTATWELPGEPTAWETTLSCDDHLAEMRSAVNPGAWPCDNPSGHPCCFIVHASDCQVHNEPYSQVGKCNCGAIP